jgi:hypothetical protein
VGALVAGTEEELGAAAKLSDGIFMPR